MWTGATGNYAYDMLYQEVNDAPEDLQANLTSTTPEPASMVLLGTGMLLVVLVFRRQTRMGTLA